MNFSKKSQISDIDKQVQENGIVVYHRNIWVRAYEQVARNLAEDIDNEIIESFMLR